MSSNSSDSSSYDSCEEDIDITESNKTEDLRVKFNEKFLTHRQNHRDQNRLTFYTQKGLITLNRNKNLSSQPSIMSGSGSNNHVSAADPQLAGLDQTTLDYLNQLITQKLSVNSAQNTGGNNNTQSGSSGPPPTDPSTQPPPQNQNLRVTTVNYKVLPPEYNPDRMTSTAYFTKCEKYFISQHIKPDDYHHVIQTILRGSMRLWYDTVVDNIHNWDEFKLAFTSRFDNASVQEKRKTLLWTRKQKYYESCEQYILEMVTLARQIDPNEDDSVSVKRAFNGLVPDLKIAAGNLQNLTVDSLLEILSGIYDTVRAKDRINKTFTRLPPLFGYTVETGPQFQNAGMGRGKVNEGNNSFRPRSFSFPNQTYAPRFHNNFDRQQSYFQQQQTNQQRPQFYQSQSAVPQTTYNVPRPQQQNPTNFRDRSNSLPSRPRIDKSTARCHKCGTIGHFAKECSQGQRPPAGMVMAALPTPSETQPQQFQQQPQSYPQYDQYNQNMQQQAGNFGYQNQSHHQQGPSEPQPSTSQNLNSHRSLPYSYEREYSRY